MSIRRLQPVPVASRAARAWTVRLAIRLIGAALLAGAAAPGKQAALHDLRDAAQLRSTRPAGAGHGAAGVARLRAPVTGRVTTLFGAPDDAGAASGITILAAPGAVVTSPCAGRVGFAAPFRSYGRLMIVRCGSADVVLAGMERLRVAAGQAVRAGEIVGRMAASATAPRSLYLELRRGGAAVDPAPFLVGRTSG